MNALLRVPHHIVPTLVACLLPYGGMVAFLVMSHQDTAVLRRPDGVWLFALVAIGALAPLGRLGWVLKQLVSEKDRFHLGLLLQIYASLVLIFASLYTLLQVGQVTPAFGGMLEFWSMESPGTLGHHLAMLTEVFAESLYLSVMTITTVGYGDIVPLTPLARVVTSLEALAGVGFLGITLGQYFSFCTHERLTNRQAPTSSLQSAE